MPAFFSAQVTISSTPVKAVEPADFDREVILSSGGAASFQVGFTSAEITNGVIWSPDMSTAQSAAVLRFVLPADEELWVMHPTGATYALRVFVTKVG